MKEKISVLIPTYNVEAFVEAAIQSILDQTYTNLEVIVVDDCSIDNTYNILLELQKKDERIRLFRNVSNLKIAETLNFAFSQSTGKYIARMDGDDISEPKRLEKQYEYLKRNPEISLVGSGVTLINEKGIFIQTETFPTDFDIIQKCIQYSSPVLHIWLAKREVYNYIERYRISGVEDYDFLLRILSGGFKFTNLSECLYRVRLRDGNTISSMGLQQRKAFMYAKNLYKERLVNGIDSYSPEHFKTKVKSYKLEIFLYNLSSKLLKIFILNKRSFHGIICLLTSIVLSPKNQATYLYGRYMFKKFNSK